MRRRNLTREEALGEYLIYRKRVRELLDIAQIAKDIKQRVYQPHDILGRGPDRFSETVGDTLMGLFASLLDRHKAALNVFDVWIALYPQMKTEIEGTWKKVEPCVQLVREYRNSVVAHANKDLAQYVKARVRFQEKRQEIIEAMQKFLQLAANLMRQEPVALPALSAEVEPILRKLLPNPRSQSIQGLRNYFLGWGDQAHDP